MSKEVDIDFVYNRWLNGIVGPDNDRSQLYLKKERRSYLRDLFYDLVQLGVDYEEALGLERRVLSDLVSEDGHKAKKKEHKTWLPNAKKDFHEVITDYFDPNSGITVNSVVYVEGKFKIDRNENIVNWAKKNFGEENEDMIEEAHNMHSMICMNYFQELMENKLNEQSTSEG